MLLQDSQGRSLHLPKIDAVSTYDAVCIDAVCVPYVWEYERNIQPTSQCYAGSSKTKNLFTLYN